MSFSISLVMTGSGFRAKADISTCVDKSSRLSSSQLVRNQAAIYETFVIDKFLDVLGSQSVWHKRCFFRCYKSKGAMNPFTEKNCHNKIRFPKLAKETNRGKTRKKDRTHNRRQLWHRSRQGCRAGGAVGARPARPARSHISFECDVPSELPRRTIPTDFYRCMECWS